MAPTQDVIAVEFVKSFTTRSYNAQLDMLTFVVQTSTEPLVLASYHIVTVGLVQSRAEAVKLDEEFY